MTENIIHEIVPVGWLQCNCSVIGDPQTREAIVVDPGDEVERILEIIARHRLNVRAIVNTHAHFDHVGGLVKMKRATGAPVLMHREDLGLYKLLETQAAMIGVEAPPMTEVDAFLSEGETLRWGAHEARVIHTPGHSPGSVCLHIPAARGVAVAEEGAASSAPTAGRLIAGDTLFAGSIGRTDLWGGSFDAIIDSIRAKLLSLPDDTRVFPGHGPQTTIGEERESNPFLR